MALLPWIGFGYGLWERGSRISPFIVWPKMVLLFGVWLFGHAGAMWLNAVLDQDHGPVLLGRAVQVPPHTAAAGYGALLVSVSLALPLGVGAATCAFACAVASILYSHPRVALKGSAVGGPLINGIGYGILSPTAGWAVTGAPPTWRAAISLGIVVVFILGAYFAAQAFQQHEDARRGYRTLVVTHGPRWTLSVARMCSIVGSVGLTGMAALGAYPRAMLAAAPALFWADRHLARWRRAPGGGDDGWASRLVVRWAVVAVTVVAAAYAHQLVQLRFDAPAGGCGTALVPASLFALCSR